MCGNENITHYIMYKMEINFNHNVASQLWNVRRIKNSLTTCGPATTHAAPCLALTLAVWWMMLPWRDAGVPKELTWTKETSAPQRQSVYVTTMVGQRCQGMLLSTDDSGELMCLLSFIMLKWSSGIYLYSANSQKVLYAVLSFTTSLM